jgi:PAS domain S-box-containing protein
VRREYERIWTQLGGRTVEELIELPLMSNAVSLATLDVLTKLGPPAWHTDANLLSLVVCRAVNLSLEGGNCDGSCYAYVLLGAIAGPRFGNYQAGFRFGQLGYDLVEQRGLKRFQAEIYVTLDLVLPWTRHVRACRDLVRRAFEAANKSGDLTCAAYCCNQLNANLLAAGDPLAETQREAENGLAFAQKMRFGRVIDYIAVQLGLIRTLRGLTPHFGRFDDEQFDELRMERRFSRNRELAQPEAFYWIRKLQARFLAGDYAAALEASERAQRLLWTSTARYEVVEYHFYGALAQAASCESAAASQRRQHVEALATHHRQLAVWAEHSPENFAHRAALVGAEIARLEGRALDAMDLYEQAIHSTRANGFVHHEALAHELAGRFALQRGFETAGAAHLRHARACYALWGADGKVRHLDARYPHLHQAEPAPDARGTIGAPLAHLDLATVLNVSQAISGELVLDTLIETLLRTALEHAGAERGLLLVPRGGDLAIQAEATTSGSAVVVRLGETPVSAAALPESVVRYTARTHESVLLDDAAVHHPFATDAYLRAQPARSVLCVPLVKQGALVALLYLENTLAPHVFTPARLAVLQVLASEAALALENSRLYRELQEREAQIRRLVDANIIGIILWDRDGRIHEANDAFLAMVGYDREELVGGHVRWRELTPAEWHTADERALAELAATGSCAPREKEYVRKDGRRVPVLVGAAVFEGRQDEGVAFVLDLTERKCAEEALRQAQAELAHVTRVATLGELTASIAHEINQPLGAMVNSANACVRWLAAQNLERAQQSAVRVVANGQRAGDIITRIRALAQKAPAHKDWLDINATIRDVLALARSEVHRHGVVVETQLAADVPRILGDRIQLQQVLLNLVMNAIEALSGVSAGPRTLWVSSECGAVPEVVIAVRDSGPGLEPEGRERLFEAFYTTKPQGLGLGLAISRRIIEAHGGRLWASAHNDHGATFHFTLPTAEGNPQA